MSCENSSYGITSFPFFTVLAFFRNRSVRRSEDATEAFWSREYESNHIRKKDISDLSYIEIPLDALPLHVCSSERCISLESQLTVLAGKKIVNLSNLSNTDLKLTYGTANLTVLSEYDQNFTQLSNLLYSYGKELEDNGFHREAIQVLEYGISIHCDASRLFVFLASLYQKDHATDKIRALIEEASALSPLLRDATVKQLEDLLNGADAS